MLAVGATLDENGAAGEGGAPAVRRAPRPRIGGARKAAEQCELDPFGIFGQAASGRDPEGRPTSPAGLSQGEMARLLETLTGGDGEWGAAWAPPGGGADARATRIATAGDACPDCCGRLRVISLEYVCEDCAAVLQPADPQQLVPESQDTEASGEGVHRRRLRIVGPGSKWRQNDLDRSNPVDTTEVQKKATYDELLRMNKSFEDRGGNPFPVDVLESVACSYGHVQRTAVKRSQTKKALLATLMYHTCFNKGFARTKSDVASFAGLQNAGIAPGDDFIRKLDGVCELGIDLDCDHVRPLVHTAFAQLGRGSAEYDDLRDAACELVNVANAKMAGVGPVLRSRAIAACYVVLLRKGGAAEVPLDKVVAKITIRKHTIDNVVRETFYQYHHKFFAEIYRKYGLNDAKKLPGLAKPPPKPKR
jgi:hypothetical protein